MNRNFEEDREALIDLVIWYRDHYYSSGYKDHLNDMIKTIQNCTNTDELAMYEVIIDGWIDY